MFIIRFGLFEFLIIFFGFCDVFAFFQNYINYILFDLLNQNYIIYLNNILIYFSNIADYYNQIHDIVQQFINIKFQIDINKYKFEIQKTKYMGVIIILKDIEMDSEKVKTILEWKSFIKLKDFQCFLNFANCY